MTEIIDLKKIDGVWSFVSQFYDGYIQCDYIAYNGDLERVVAMEEIFHEDDPNEHDCATSLYVRIGKQIGSADEKEIVAQAKKELDESNVQIYESAITGYLQYKRREDDTSEIEISDIWEFVGDNYPNYYSSQEIAESDRFQRVVDLEFDPNAEEDDDIANDYYKEISEFLGTDNQEAIVKEARVRMNAYNTEIYYDSIEAFLEKQKEL